MDGFTYNGFDSKQLHVYVNPGPTERWFESPEFESKTSEGAWRNGGYYYGNRVKTRKISFSCYFEDVTQRQREKIRWWLNRDSDGYLIFDERPFVKYKVHPEAITGGKIYATEYNDRNEMLYSGVFTANFTAYDPFGYLMYQSYTNYDEAGALKYCNIMHDDYMPSKPNVNSRSFLIYNPGTEKTALTLEIGGSAPNGLTITNEQNGTQCVQNGLPPNGTLKIDGDTGQITNKGDYAFSYHDYGFITLEPCLEMVDDIIISYTDTYKVVGVGGMYTMTDALVGKYMWIEDTWKKITEVFSDGRVAIESMAGATGHKASRIVDMNKITISGTNVTLTTLDYSFEPRIL